MNLSLLFFSFKKKKLNFKYSIQINTILKLYVKPHQHLIKFNEKRFFFFF